MNRAIRYKFWIILRNMIIIPGLLFLAGTGVLFFLSHDSSDHYDEIADQLFENRYENVVIVNKAGDNLDPEYIYAEIAVIDEDNDRIIVLKPVNAGTFGMCYSNIIPLSEFIENKINE